MNEAEKAACAASLHSGYLEKRPFAPLRHNGAAVDLSAAYDIQHQVYTKMASRRGAPTIEGHKIALTSPAIQELCGVNQPIYGSIPQNKVLTSPQSLSRAHYQRLGLEFEVAFVLKMDLPIMKEGYNVGSIVEFVDYCMPAFEIIEDRAADYSDLDAASIAADRCWCDGIILGSRCDDWMSLDFTSLPVTLKRNGRVYDTAVTGDALGNPLAGLCWVANHLQSRGQTICKGQPVMTGSSLKTEFPDAGETFEFSIQDVGSCSVEVTA